MIAEDLSECERIKLLLNKRDPNQYGYVFLNAVSIFRDDIEMQSEIIPILVEKIREYSEDQQIIAGDAFSELIEGNVSTNCISQTRSSLVVDWPCDVTRPTGTCFRINQLFIKPNRCLFFGADFGRTVRRAGLHPGRRDAQPVEQTDT